MVDFETLLSGGVESPMKHHPYAILTLTSISNRRTLSGGQFEWGACLKMYSFSVSNKIIVTVLFEKLCEWIWNGAFWLYAGNTAYIEILVILLYNERVIVKKFNRSGQSAGKSSVK